VFQESLFSSQREILKFKQFYHSFIVWVNSCTRCWEFVCDRWPDCWHLDKIISELTFAFEIRKLTFRVLALRRSLVILPTDVIAVSLKTYPTLHMEMSFACLFVFIQNKLIFIWKIFMKTRFETEVQGKLRKGLLQTGLWGRLPTKLLDLCCVIVDRKHVVNKPLRAAGMSADNVRGWETIEHNLSAKDIISQHTSKPDRGLLILLPSH